MASLKLVLALLMVVGLSLAAPEPEPEPEADPQYKSYKSVPPVYEPNKYPVYPKQHQDYPTHYPKAEPYYPKPEPHYPKPEPYYPKPEYYPQKPTYGHQPSKKDYYCDPRSPPKCVYSTNATFCLKDYEYPEQEIQQAIEYDPMILKKYAEVADQSANNLVDGVSSVEENHFDYSLYNGNPFDKGNWIGDEGYICPSEVLYARPVRAKNVDGEWRVVVQNVNYYTQTQRVETCLYAGASCRTLAPCYRSKCVQKYIYHRMLSYDPCDPYKGLFIDIYKLPSACSCHIPQYKL